MTELILKCTMNLVTSHTGCVSRNLIHLQFQDQESVTSHTGCVSRNYIITKGLNYVNPVTSHTGCVSRNYIMTISILILEVTSHTGCVSRNDYEKTYALSILVTSHTGCVSRNVRFTLSDGEEITSHPTRDV